MRVNMLLTVMTFIRLGRVPESILGNRIAAVTNT